MTERLKLFESFRGSVASLAIQAGHLCGIIERGSFDANQREALLTELGNVERNVRTAVDDGVDALIRPTTGTKPGEWTTALLKLIASIRDDLTILARNWFVGAGPDDIDSLLERKHRDAEYRPILERTRQRAIELQAKSDFLANFDVSVVESDGVKSEVSDERWIWFLYPFKTQPKRRRRISHEEFYGGKPLAEKTQPKPPVLPLKLVVEPGATITQEAESMRRPRVFSLESGEPLEPPRLVKVAVKLYAPTDRELSLMQSWGYDEQNPDWNRYADELAKLLLVVGSAPPQNWRVSPEWQNRTASWLVDLMADLKRQTRTETLTKSQQDLANMLSDFWDNPANAGINDDISRDICMAHQ